VDSSGSRLGCGESPLGDFEMGESKWRSVDSSGSRLILRRLSLGDFETDSDTKSMFFYFGLFLQKRITKTINFSQK
jgi:hypothetical protein